MSCTCGGTPHGYPEHEPGCGIDPADLWDLDDELESYLADPNNDPEPEENL